MIDQTNIDTGVVIEKLTPFASNEKGMTIEQMERSTIKYLIGYRSKGAQFGNHYHEGKSGSKNPEILWLLQGCWSLEYKALNEKSFTKVQVVAPSRVEIYPNIIHKIEALEDSVFIEFNSLKEHNQDTKYPE